MATPRSRYQSGDKVFCSMTQKNEIITIYGAGKFAESKLVLNKDRAMLIYIELHKFIQQ